MSNESAKPIYLEEQEDEGSWMVSYADMITILLAFFTIFFSFDPTSSGEDLLDNSLATQFAELNTAVSMEQPVVLEDEAMEQMLGDLSERKEIVLEKLGPGQFGIYFKGVSFFSSGQTDIREEAVAELEKFVEFIRPFLGQYKIKIHSFTDPRPISMNVVRRYEDNVELSTLRSLKVFRLLKGYGVSEKNLDIVGLGVFPAEFLEKYLKVEEVKENYHLMRTTMFIIERHGML